MICSIIANSIELYIVMHSGQHKDRISNRAYQKGDSY